MLRGFRRVRKGNNLRVNHCVDDKIDIPSFENFCFSRLDFCNKPYMISMPYGPIQLRGVLKPKYWLDYNTENNSFHNKVYWCSRITTHETRRTFFNFYHNTVDDARFDINEFGMNKI